MGAGLAQLDPDALHVAHEEALPDQRVEPRTARVDLAAALARAELDSVLRCQRLDRLGLDEGDLATRLVRLGIEVVAVALEAVTGHRLDLGHLDEQPGLHRTDVDRLYVAFAAHGRKRATLSATQTGFSPPSISTVNFVTAWNQPPPTSSTEITSEYARTFDPAGTGAGKRTLFQP